MDKTLHKYIKKLNTNPGVLDDTIKTFEISINFELPEIYKRFLLLTNGGEGFIGENSYIILWSLQDLLEFNKSYEANEYVPGLFLIGSNGGGEAYAFDLRTIPYAIVQVPFVGMDLKLVEIVGEDFLIFLENLYNADE